MPMNAADTHSGCSHPAHAAHPRRDLAVRPAQRARRPPSRRGYGALGAGLLCTLVLLQVLGGAGLGGASAFQLPPATAVAVPASAKSASGLLTGLTIQQAHLTAGDGVASDYFGHSVAVSGDTALIGAIWDDVGGNADQGSAYVFVRSGAGWLQQTKLTVPDGAAGDYFGWSVALDGETAVVGARNDAIGTNAGQGSAYVFARSGTAWILQAKLTAADGGANDAFGSSVAVHGDTALVAATGHDVGGRTDQGAAYAFARSGASWSQQAELTASDGAAGDFFGCSVALAGDTSLVGASGHDIGGNTNQGAAYVFVRSGTAWSQQARLAAADGAANDAFGSSVAVSGDTAVVGAPRHDVGGRADQGAAYVFVRSGAAWGQQAELTASAGAAADVFGTSVALCDDCALAGAPRDYLGHSSSPGSAYAFVRSASDWSQKAELAAADGTVGDFFGDMVALSGDNALAGAFYDDVGANADQGSAYAFTLDLVAPTTTLALAPAADGRGWNDSAVTVTLSAADSGSGPDKTYYSLDGGDSISVYDAAAKPVVTAEGTTAVLYYSTDVAGNVEAVKGVAVHVDTTRPSTAPVLSPPANGAGWNNRPVTLALTATDAGSGPDKTYYRLGTSGPFIVYDPAAKPAVTAEGTTTVEYYSTDLVGNAESAASLTVRIDSTAPVTSVPAGALPSGWSKKPATIVFVPDDARSGMNGGAAKTEYSSDGGATWTTGISATVSAQGSTTLQYRSIDAAGNVEAAKSATVRIDSAKPITRAYKATVRKGEKVKLAYKVADALPGSGQATVTLKIFKGSMLRKTIKLPGASACNARQSHAWKCTLPRGRYTLKVYATDLAGNAQSKVGSARLTVE
jgi:hypothetical protein